jgi:hypothetical protein
MSNATKVEFMSILKKETNNPTEIIDKIRLLTIYVLCTSDISELRSLCELLKTLHPNDFDESFINSMIKKRKDFS